MFFKVFGNLKFFKPTLRGLKLIDSIACFLEMNIVKLAQSVGSSSSSSSMYEVGLKNFRAFLELALAETFSQ